MEDKYITVYTLDDLELEVGKCYPIFIDEDFCIPIIIPDEDQ